MPAEVVSRPPLHFARTSGRPHNATRRSPLDHFLRTHDRIDTLGMQARKAGQTPTWTATDSYLLVQK